MPKGLQGFQKGNKFGLNNKYNIGKIPWNKGKKGYTNKRKGFYKKCPQCNKEFYTVKSLNYKFCSKKCRFPNGYKILIKCNNCNKNFLRWKNLIDKRKYNFCSTICQYEFYSKLYIGRFLGEKSPLWQGGKNNHKYGSGWTKTLKQIILRRDNYKCRLCGTPQEECIKSLIVHHINYQKKNHFHSNLVTLCRICHNKTNYNRDYWKNYFINKMEVKNARIQSQIFK